MLALTRRSPDQQSGRNIVRAEVESPPSFLGPGVRVQGRLEIDGALVIGGLVKGHIAALKLTIAAGGYVEGDIVAREVIITGSLNGRVFAPQVTIDASAEIDGRIFHTQVTVARGARVVGRMPWRPVSYFENLANLPEIRP